MKEFLKGFWKKFGDRIIVFCSVLLTIGIAFLFGRLSAIENGKLPINIRASVSQEKIENASSPEEGQIETRQSETGENNSNQPKYGFFVASKNSKIYHLWNCPSTARMNDKNKLWFDTIEEAEETGRTIATDCVQSVKP